VIFFNAATDNARNIGSYSLVDGAVILADIAPVGTPLLLLRFVLG
jgi:hypothetical protein